MKFLKNKLLLVGLMVPMIGLSAHGVINNNKPVVQSHQEAKTNVKDPYTGSGTLHYDYSGHSTDFSADHTDLIPNWDQNFTKRTLNVDFNFETWNNHKLSILYEISFNKSSKESIKTIVNETDKKYPLIEDKSGLAQQDISLTDIQVILDSHNHLYLWWKYWVYSSFANNDIHMISTFSWTNE